MPARGRAIVQRHASGLVDEEAQEPPAIRRLHIDQLVAHAGHCRLDDFFEAQTKNGPKPISSKTKTKTAMPL
jgi:hypothetical protein